SWTSMCSLWLSTGWATSAVTTTVRPNLWVLVATRMRPCTCRRVVNVWTGWMPARPRPGVNGRRRLCRRAMMNSSRSTRTVMTDPVAEHFTRHVVCPNPAIDHLQIVETFEPFEVNRVIEVTSLPGGKGMIVARGARRMGANVVAYGFVGGLTGQAIR